MVQGHQLAKLEGRRAQEHDWERTLRHDVYRRRSLEMDCRTLRRETRLCLSKFLTLFQSFKTKIFCDRDFTELYCFVWPTVLMSLFNDEVQTFCEKG